MTAMLPLFDTAELTETVVFDPMVDRLRAAAATANAVWPHLAEQYATWTVAYTAKRIWRFGVMLADRHEAVLVNPDGTRFYSATVRTDCQARPGDLLHVTVTATVEDGDLPPF